MTKNDFLRKLKRFLPADDRKDIISDFEDHFATGLAEGKMEEEIAKELGEPSDVAKEFGYVKEKLEPRNVVFAAIGILFFDLIIGIALVASLFSIWISLWSVVLSLLITGVALLIAMFFTAFIAPIPWLACLTAGISILALTGLFTIGMVYVTKYYFKAMAWFGMLHVRIFDGKK